MAKWVKKKFNVGLFIVLLLCAFIPGIIYGIYCAIPARISEEKPKKSGWIGALVGSGVNVLLWVYWIVNIAINEGSNDVPEMFILTLAFAALLFIFVLLDKKGKSVFLTFSSIFFAVIGLILNLVYLFYAWVGIIALIVTIVCLFKMQKYHKYEAYGAKVEEETVKEVAEEVAE